MQIVLARIKYELAIDKSGRVDLGEFHTFKMIASAVALMWLNDGTEADVKKAEEYAEKEHYRVFVYQNEPDPLNRAKLDIFA